MFPVRSLIVNLRLWAIAFFKQHSVNKASSGFEEADKANLSIALNRFLEK